MKLELRELVRQYVDELIEEATRRENYIDAIYNVLKGAMGEYYKARFAEVNGDPDPSLRVHWDEEVDEHFRYRFADVVSRPFKGKFDRRKAFEEAMEAIQDAVSRELDRSGRIFAKNFDLKFKGLEYPSDNVTDEFIARCWNEFEERAWKSR